MYSKYNKHLETYEQEFEYECIECEERYQDGENACPNCGSMLAKIASDDDEINELSF